jgi:hypothetical protein
VSIKSTTRAGWCKKNHLKAFTFRLDNFCISLGAMNQVLITAFDETELALC